MTKYVDPMGPLQAVGGDTIVTDVFHSMRSFEGVSWLHAATDLVNNKNPRINFTTVGEVIRREKERTLGNHVLTREPSTGIQVVYAHLKEPSPVNVGQWVTPADFCGIMGETGLASGPHLHIAASANTPEKAAAEMVSVGVPYEVAVYNVHYRLNQAFFNLQLCWNRSARKEQEMRVFFTIDPKPSPAYGHYYEAGPGVLRHLGDMTEVNMALRTAQQSVPENCYMAEIKALARTAQRPNATTFPGG
jgi:murein DD-endopeptidase MepM/ murein hydrolase activator NlpD